MWMYVPDEKAFRHAKMKGHQTYVESSSWFGEGGEEMSAGGFYKWSKRYRELTLSKPYIIKAETQSGFLREVKRGALDAA